MESVYVTNKIFENIVVQENPLGKGEYEYCKFLNCDFSKFDLSGFTFLECEFINCNLSFVKLEKTTLIGVEFKDCKMLGIIFENVNNFNFDVRFENCALNHSSFYRLKMKKTNFTGSQLGEVDFSESDLTEAVFDDCDFSGAIFANTILEKTDFRTSFNFSIDPELNKMKKAKFSSSNVSGLLRKYDVEIDPR